MIPESHLRLLTEPIHGVLTTLMPDGQPQSSIVWVDYDVPYVLINTSLERQKCQNIQANPKVSVLVIDPKDTTRWVSIRGEVVTCTECDAEGHADRLTQAYSGGTKQHFYGDIYPEARRDQETRVILKIMPVKVNLDAIFK